MNAGEGGAGCQLGRSTKGDRAGGGAPTGSASRAPLPPLPPTHPLTHPPTRATSSPTRPQTEFGVSVGVVGSFNGWDEKEPLALNWSEGGVWTGEAELPAG